MDMDESDSHMNYAESNYLTKKRIEYDLPLATNGKKNKKTNQKRIKLHNNREQR